MNVLITNLEEIKQRILDKYSIEDLIKLLNISVEDIIERFSEEIIENLSEFDVTTELDFSEENE